MKLETAVTLAWIFLDKAAYVIKNSGSHDEYVYIHSQIIDKTRRAFITELFA